MQIRIPGRRRGTVLAFTLMALIAILALTVVFYSRAGRSKPEETVVESQTAPNPVPSELDVTTGSIAATNPADDSETPPPASTPMPMPPPPPPPIATPDDRNLPPEG